MIRRTLLFTLPALLVAAPGAGAVNYPPPGNPGTVKHHPDGKHVTFRVCKHGKKRVRTIQKAVNLAAAGDTIKVCDGTYRESVTIQTKAKARLKLLGDVKHPRRVVIDLAGKRGAKAQNAVIVNGANGVTVSGFWARHYKANGFFALSVRGYTFTHLVASLGGEYGIYAFKSKGGTMSYDEGYYNNDAGFYIGGTPPQTKPLRSTVSHDKSWGNVIGFSGTNVRYTTITKSDFYNNGTGITANAATSEPYTGPAHNTIIGNRIFWNDFNFRKGAPFSLVGTSIGSVPYPQGIGIILFGGHDNSYESNQIFGNWLGGAGLLNQVLLSGDTTAKAADRAAASVNNNSISHNAFGRAGTDLNGRDLYYDGSGRGNCFSGNTGVQLTEPVSASYFPACPFSGPNAGGTQGSTAETGTLVGYAGDPESNWKRHPHSTVAGVKPLELCTVTKTGCQGFPKG